MDIAQFKYFLDDLAHREDVSLHCKNIREIFFSVITDSQKLDQTISYLKTAQALDDDTLSLLKRGIRGPYGSEGITLTVTSKEETEFWLSLHHLFPNIGKLTLVAAEANLTATIAAEESYAPLFIMAIKQLDNIYEVGGETGALILNSKYRFDYQLLFLAQALKDKDEYPADAAAEINELLGEYAFDAKKIKLIQEMIEQYQTK